MVILKRKFMCIHLLSILIPLYNVATLPAPLKKLLKKAPLKLGFPNLVLQAWFSKFSPTIGSFMFSSGIYSEVWSWHYNASPLCWWHDQYLKWYIWHLEFKLHIYHSIWRVLIISFLFLELEDSINDDCYCLTVVTRKKLIKKIIILIVI